MDAIIENLPTFLGGFWNTLQLLFLAGIGSLVLGTIIAAMRISPVSALRTFATVYTEILRNTPLTLVLFFCAYILPYLGVGLEYFTFAVIGLTAYTSPFIAEAIRSGINGVALGQAHIQPDAAVDHPPAGYPDGNPTPAERHHRVDQKHLGRRRIFCC
jgi:glutamate transport system permease protein